MLSRLRAAIAGEATRSLKQNITLNALICRHANLLLAQGWPEETDVDQRNRTIRQLMFCWMRPAGDVTYQPSRRRTAAAPGLRHSQTDRNRGGTALSGSQWQSLPVLPGRRNAQCISRMPVSGWQRTKSGQFLMRYAMPDSAVSLPGGRRYAAYPGGADHHRSDVTDPPDAPSPGS